MYRVIKPTGYGANVSVENMETHASVMIGGTTRNVMDILREVGFTEDEINTSLEWNLEIDQDTAKKLVALTMKMKKPIRDQRKKPTEDKPTTGKVGVDIDAFDLIYGI